MKISVAMCTYNGAAYLQQQLDSIAAQTRQPDELVICDDQSADDTRKIVETFASRFPAKTRLYFNEKNLGSTRNFERAINLCEGEIIALADQDDVWHPEKLALMESEFQAAPHVGLVFTDLEVVDEKLLPLGYRAWQCEWVEFTRHEQEFVKKGRAFDLLLTRNVVTGSAMAFRSKYRHLVAPTPEISKWFVHDYWIALLIAAVSDIAFIETPLVKYRHYPAQQIGLLPTPKTHPTRRAEAQRHLKSYPIQAYLMKLVHERLSAGEHAADYAGAISKLGAAIAHEQARAELPQKKFTGRAAWVLKELSALRYHIFRHPHSNVLFDAARDLMPYRVLHLSSYVTNALARQSNQKGPH
jgi:glycosyltransferase involved in cell wall biosynthesis